MTKPFSIANRAIDNQHPPFIIAELSGNHNQSLDRALQLVDIAAEAGADAIKLQTYTADTITMPGTFQIDDKGSLWNGEELHSLYQKAFTPWEWHEKIFKHARERGLIAFSSPFDETAVDFLEDLNVPAYKVASFENEHFPLLRKIVETGKPIIMSTGVIEQKALDETVSYIRTLGAQNFMLLKCTSNYPSSPEDTNLRTIPDMVSRYNCQVGLSDHSMGIGVSIAAVAVGATAIEKHLTLRRSDGGVDSKFSMEPSEFKALVKETTNAWIALGEVTYTLGEKEKSQLVYKRSIFAIRDLPAGHCIVSGDIRVIRPALGLHPRDFDATLGRRLVKPVCRGEPLTKDHFR